MALPIICIVQPDIFDWKYILIIVSRYLRIILAANILTAGEMLSSNEVTSQLYKMVINLTMLIMISALLFTGIENHTLLSSVKETCDFNRPSDCLDPAY